jgi:glycosyltransferase involved in cell wall biosynthesis
MELHQNKQLVSVCIPTYNNARYIGRTIDSIVNQTYKNIEIVICDNASTDNTREIVHSYSDKRIRYHRNPKTIHALSNWNLCIELANADFVAIYHSDDVYEPTIVEKELRLLKKNSNLGAVFCLDKIIDENGILLKNGVNLPEKIRDKGILNFKVLFTVLLEKNMGFLVAPTFMARKNIFTNVSLFNDTEKFGDSFGSAGDTEMWLRISQKYEIGIVKERLIRRRVSITQGSNIYESKRFSRANHFIVLDSFLNSVREEIDKSLLAQYEYNKFVDDLIIAKNLLRNGQHNKAKLFLISIFSYGRLMMSFKSFNNFQKMGLYIFLLFCSIMGISGGIIGFFINIKHRLLKC